MLLRKTFAITVLGARCISANLLAGFLNGYLDDKNGTEASVLNIFLGDHDTVIFQNDVVGNQSTCAAMTVLFARGTAEPGMSVLFYSWSKDVLSEIRHHGAG